MVARVHVKVYILGMTNTTCTIDIEINEIHGYLERAWIAQGLTAAKMAAEMHRAGWRVDWKQESLRKG